MANRVLFRTSRRNFLLSSGAGVAALAAPAVWTSTRAQDRRIVVRDPGGPFTEAFRVAFHDPFTAATGVEVVGVASANEPVSEIKSIVQSGAKTWDIAGGVTVATVRQLLLDGDYVEKHELGDHPLVKEIPPEYRDEYAIGVEVYATNLGYNRDKFKDKPPQSWADFFDVENFPGTRAMRKNPADTVEIALFADGVSAQDMYPCDIDRAFAKLDQIKPHITAWWTAGAQATQMLATGEIDMLPVWCSRSAAAAEQGAPIDMMWNQNIWGADVWAILKGTDHLDICRDYIAFTCDAERQAALAPYVVNGPTNPKAYDYIDPERAKILSTNPEYRAKGMPIGHDYWAENRDEVSERFNSWLLS